VTVNDVAPTVTFTDPPAVAGSPVNFTASATDVSPAVQAAGFTYAWTFGDGSTGTGSTTSHTYASAGTYTVTVSATDEYGKAGTSTGTITILSAPVVNAGSALTVNAQSSLTFSQATESGGTAPFTYSWNFGDGTTPSGSLNPSHTYANPRSYTATLTVTDANKLSSSSSVVVTVNDVAPTVTYTDPTAVAGSPVNFTASATDISPAVQAAGFSYAWTFGDGSTGTGSTTSHTYASAGTYTVTVSATDEYGKVGTGSGTITITAPGSSTVLFHDTFPSNTPSSAWTFVGGTWSINSGVLSQTTELAEDPQKAMITDQSYPSNLIITAEVQVNTWNGVDRSRVGVGLYTNPSSGDGYNLIFHGTNQVQFLNDQVAWGNAYTFNWQVGTWYWFQLEENNGTLEGKVWAAGTAEPQNWMFQQTGWSSLTGGAPALNGGSGGSTDSFASVSVTTTSVQPDTASAGTAITATAGMPTTFSQASATGTGPLTYIWNYGDGSTSTGALEPSHTYHSSGTYTAQLTVTDTLGIPAMSTVTVTVDPPPPSPTVSLNAPSTGFTGTSMAFSAIATDVNPGDEAAGFTYLWNFGDGTTATGLSATHTYALDALYTVTVSATDEFGSVGTAAAQVNVFRPGLAGNTTATYYNLTPPNSAMLVVGTPSGSFTVGLPNGRYVSSPVTVTPNDGGEGGTFTPSSVVLSGANPTATFTYTAAQAGTITIATTDNGGLNNPPSATLTVQSLVKTYTLSGPGSGEVATAATFTLTLGTGWLNNPVQLTLSASNGDGAFIPSSIILTNTSRSATFTYTPTLYDARNIVTTNNGGLTDPAPLSFVSMVQLGSSGVLPMNNYAPDLGGFNFFANGPWLQALGAPAGGDPISPYSNADIGEFSYSLSGTVQVTQGSVNVVGTATAFTTQLGNQYLAEYVIFGNDASSSYYQVGTITDNTHLTLTTPYAGNSGSNLSFRLVANLTVGFWPPSLDGGGSLWGNPINVVPGTQPLVPLTLGQYASESSPGPVPFFPGMSVESWPYWNGDGWLSQQINGTWVDGTVTLTKGSASVSGNNMAFTSQLFSGAVILFGNDPTEYTVASISDNNDLVLTQPYAGSLTTNVEVWGPVGLAPMPGQPQIDNHALVMVRDETTGGIDTLYEYWATQVQNASANPIVWMAGGGTEYNLLTGAPPPEGYTSSDAAGTPLSPFLVTYPEAAANAIDHPLRLCIGAAELMNAFVWPARHSAGEGAASSGLPMGAELVLSDAWYNANIAKFSPINQAILNALHTYGGIVDDVTGGGMSIDGVNDARWNAQDLIQLENIPITAFQVVDTIKSPVTFTGPTTGTVGSPLNYSIQYTNAADSNFDDNMWVQMTAPNGAQSFVGSSWISDNARSMTASFTPTAPGTYTLHLISSIAWMLPADITVTVTGASAPSLVVTPQAPKTSSSPSGIAPLVTAIDTTAKPPTPTKGVVSLRSSMPQEHEASSQHQLTVAMSLPAAQTEVKSLFSPASARFRSKK